LIPGTAIVSLLWTARHTIVSALRGFPSSLTSHLAGAWHGIVGAWHGIVGAWHGTVAVATKLILGIACWKLVAIAAGIGVIGYGAYRFCKYMKSLWASREEVEAENHQLKKTRSRLE